MNKKKRKSSAGTSIDGDELRELLNRHSVQFGAGPSLIPTEKKTFKENAFRRMSKAIFGYKDKDLVESDGSDLSIDRDSDIGDSRSGLTGSNIQRGLNRTAGRKYSVGEKLKRKELIEEHRQTSSKLRDANTQVNHLHKILYNLDDWFRKSASDCACFRFTDMRTMIEVALEQWHSPADVRDKADSTVHRLVANSKRLSLAMKEDEKERDMYKHMTDKDLNHSLLTTLRDHEQKEEIRKSAIEKLAHLENRYTHLNKYCCVRRYGLLKSMIQEATRDCLNDDDS